MVGRCCLITVGRARAKDEQFSNIVSYIALPLLLIVQGVKQTIPMAVCVVARRAARASKSNTDKRGRFGV